MPAFTCIKSAMELLEQYVKHVNYDVVLRSLIVNSLNFTNFSGVSIVNFEQVNSGWLADCSKYCAIPVVDTYHSVRNMQNDNN